MTQSISRMKNNFIFVSLLILGISLSIVPGQASAQSALERISAHERSDGLGFVIRYHLTEPADSFKLVQPAPDHIQMLIYSDGLDTMNLELPSNSGPFSEIEVYKTDKGVGADFFLNAGYYFKTRAYPDQNRKHLLLALERTTSSEVNRITEGVEPLVWKTEQTETDNIYEDLDDDDSFLRLREGRNFNVVVLDAGHGGHDPGTTNRQLGLSEKDIALAVTLKVGEYIEQYLPDVKVVYTRTEDKFVPLSQRGLIATRSKADLFVSIHVNSVANSPSANGTETFFLGLARSESALEVMKRENSVVDLENGNASLDLSEEELLIYELTNSGNMAISERIATMIETQFSERAGRRSRGVKQAGLEALWHASTPAVLVELGFLSNPQEARFLSSEYGQSIMASAIFRAVRDFKLEYERSLRVNGNNRASND
jgi:N-acetylmuramoyl-L-alanine amidase